MDKEWKKTKLVDAFEKLGSSEKGISGKEAAARLLRWGRNEIRETRRISPLRILASQFASPLILVLVAAAVISAGLSFMEEESTYIDTILILLIVMAAGISGFFQDWKAEKAIEALRKMSTPMAVVIRDGRETEIRAYEIVPGDVILVEGGNIIPADAKIIRAYDIMLDESMLTGESKAVRKTQSDIVYMNTSLVSGRAVLLAFATGMRTEVGKIAEKMQQMAETKTTFQNELASFSRKIFWFVVAVAAFMVAIGYFKYGFYKAFLTAVSLAVAAIPEGLPAVVTLALAFGAKFMVKRNALIRKLPVVESVGSVNVICTDKTGTLTENRMSVTRAFFSNAVYEAGRLDRRDAGKMGPMLLCGALCNNVATVMGEEGKRKIIGDQTETAIMELSRKHGFGKEDLEKKYKRVNEIPFTSKRKMMSVVYKTGGKDHVFSKGAPEVLLKLCNRIFIDGRARPLDDKAREGILKQNDEFASHALRVLAFACKESGRAIAEKGIEKGMVFLGLEAMYDPPREEVKGAIEECMTAGIRVIMITGDNVETAKAIAAEVGLESSGAISGDELGTMGKKELEEKLRKGVNIFARTSPFDKLKILEVLQKDNVVAMTGDGVNDTLALKKADVGIAMGKKGTDVAKEASDIILMDDNFATIKNSIREGRRIFDNIRKFVNYLISSNLAEVLVVFIGTMAFAVNEPILLPVHLLWINLLTDGMPALALGVDPPSPGIMKRKPRKAGEGILDRTTLYTVLSMGVNLGILLLLVFYLSLPLGFETARTTLFMGFVLYEFMRIAVIRYQEELNFFDNKLLLVSLAVSILLQMAVIYTPLSIFFDVVPIGISQWAILIAFGVAGFFSSLAVSKAAVYLANLRGNQMLSTLSNATLICQRTNNIITGDACEILTGEKSCLQTA